MGIVNCHHQDIDFFVRGRNARFAINPWNNIIMIYRFSALEKSLSNSQTDLVAKKIIAARSSYQIAYLQLIQVHNPIVIQQE